MSSSEDDSLPVFERDDDSDLETRSLDRINRRQKSKSENSSIGISQCPLEGKKPKDKIPRRYSESNKLALEIYKAPSQWTKQPNGDNAAESQQAASVQGDFPQRHLVKRVQELGTVLQVLDFGLQSDPSLIPEDALSYTESMADLQGSLDESPVVLHPDPDIDKYIDEIAADAVAEAEISDPQNRVQAAVQQVLEQHPGLTPPEIHLKPHIKEMLDEERATVSSMKSLYLGDRDPWDLRLIKEIESGIVQLTKMKVEIEAVCPEYGSGDSWSSMSSSGSLYAEREHSILQILKAMQELYYEVVDSCSRTLGFAQEWYESQDLFPNSSEMAFDYLKKLVKNLRDLRLFEVCMCDDGVGQVKVIRREDKSVAKDSRLRSLLQTINRKTREMQQILIRDSSDESEGVVKKEQSCILQRTWEGLKDLSYRAAQSQKEFKMDILQSLYDTMTEAVDKLTAVQDTEDSKAVLERAKDYSVTFKKEKKPTMPLKTASAQGWILPCLKNLHSICNDVAKQVSKCSSFKQFSGKTILNELRQKFEHLVMISISRAITLTQASEEWAIIEVQTRKDSGLRMLQLILRYDNSRLSEKFEDSERYELFRDLTTKLLNNVMLLQTKLQLFEIEGSCPKEIEEADASPGELSRGGSMSLSLNLTDYDQLGIWYPEESTASSRIPVGIDYSNVSNVISQPRSSVVGGHSRGEEVSNGAAEGLSPFERAPRGPGWNLPSNMWVPRERPTTTPQTDSVSSLRGHPLHPFPADPSLTPSDLDSSSDNFPPFETFHTIKKEELLYGPRLGCGSTGQVFKMWYRKAPVAVKVMNYPKLHESQQRLIHESKIHIRLSCHPNIVQFYGQCVDMEETDKVGLVMELCDLGSLLHVIKEARWLQMLEAEGHDMQEYENFVGYTFYTKWILRIKLACDIAAGMEYLHSREIVHRDLTSYNVVLTRGGRHPDCWIAKVCDFERSRYIPDGETIPRSDTLPNSPAWAAPEVLRSEDYSTQADVFSMGVILWEVITLKEPWKDYLSKCIRDPFQIIARVSNEERLPLFLPEQPPIPEYAALIDLISDTFKERPDDRPTMTEFHQRLDEIKKSIGRRLRDDRPRQTS